MAGIRGTRTRDLVAVRWSLSRLCGFCQGRRSVWIVWREGMDLTGPMACPHCQGKQPIELRIYPRFRTDRPRGVA